MRLLYLSLLFIFSAVTCFGQNNTLSIENVLSIVRKYHPIVKQSFLINQIANNQLAASKSIFDPNIQMYTSEKTFDGKLYYRQQLTELKIPTWYGIDLKAGLENNIGERIDPSLTKNTSSFVGLSMDPFRGLIVDKRKAIVSQAQNFVELTKNEQLLVINDLIFDATTAYWNWVNAYYTHEIFSKAVSLNKERNQVIKSAYMAGDRAAMDTIESLTQLQSFEITENQTALELQKAKNELSNFFWTENGLPYELMNNIQPDKIFDTSNIYAIDLDKLELIIASAYENHPKIKMLDAKISQLNIEKRLKTIELFPSLKMEYNALSKDNIINDFTTNFNSKNNYKYGISISMPLFQRQTRGELAKTKNKIEEQNWSKKSIGLEIENKIKNYYTEFHALQQQIKINENMLASNQVLFETENTKFQMGESSLFLINSRELKFTEAKQKLVALKSKFYANIYKIAWASGNLR